LSAFEVDAVDYLTKPVRQERLDATLARVMQRRDAVKGLVPVPSSESVLVQDRGAMVRIPVHDIVYFKAEQKQVLIKTAHQQWTTDESLTELEQRLGDRFVRVHRNALVACDAMRQLARREDPETGLEVWALKVEPVGDWLVVSRRQIALVKEKMAGS
jgi:two-component system response regulator AlgR